jgi:predicted nucleotidyltransferase
MLRVLGGKELVLTDEGKAFARARACKLVRRDTAQKNLDKLKERIQEVNSDHKRFVIFVKVAVLFGSFINSDREFLGDLDIAVILSRKPNITKDEYENHKMGCSLIQALSNPTNEVLRHLKNRSTTIQIIDIYGQESAVFKDKHEFLVGDRSLVLTEKQREDEINEKLKTGIWE